MSLPAWLILFIVGQSAKAAAGFGPPVMTIDALERAEMIEEDEWTNHAAGVKKGAPARPQTRRRDHGCVCR